MRALSAMAVAACLLLVAITGCTSQNKDEGSTSRADKANSGQDRPAEQTHRGPSGNLPSWGFCQDIEALTLAMRTFGSEANAGSSTQGKIDRNELRTRHLTLAYLLLTLAPDAPERLRPELDILRAALRKTGERLESGRGIRTVADPILAAESLAALDRLDRYHSRTCQGLEHSDKAVHTVEAMRREPCRALGEKQSRDLRMGIAGRPKERERQGYRFCQWPSMALRAEISLIAHPKKDRTTDRAIADLDPTTVAGHRAFVGTDPEKGGCSIYVSAGRRQSIQVEIPPYDPATISQDCAVARDFAAAVMSNLK